jgi:cytochrome c-type biogenesis protein CcmH
MSPRRLSVSRRLAWVGALAIASGALLFGEFADPPPRTNTDRVYGLAENFACPVCQGQSVAESDVPVAREIRRQIGVWVDDGRTDGFIRDQLVGFYGEDIDYNPAASGVTSLVWILPVVAAAAAVAGLVIVFRGWRVQADLEAAAEDVALVETERARDLP